jgi:phenolic acid decarboxylase
MIFLFQALTFLSSINLHPQIIIIYTQNNHGIDLIKIGVEVYVDYPTFLRYLVHETCYGIGVEILDSSLMFCNF